MKEEINKVLTKNDIIKEKEILRIAEIYLNKKDIKVNNIEFIEKSPEYDFGTNELRLSVNYNSNWLKQELDEFKNNKNLKIIKNIDDIEINEKLINCILIFLTLHEIRHAEQNKILSETYMNYDKTYVKYLLISLLKSTAFLKMLYHDKLYFEYDANINSMINFKNIENCEFKRYLAYKFLIAHTNKNGTEFTNPIESNKNTFGTSLSDLPNFDVTNYVSDCNDEIEKSYLFGSKTDNEYFNRVSKIYIKK